MLIDFRLWKSAFVAGLAGWRRPLDSQSAAALCGEYWV
jgi:hypothetical protein